MPEGKGWLGAPPPLIKCLRTVQKIEAAIVREPCGVGSRGPLKGPGGVQGAKPPEALVFFSRKQHFQCKIIHKIGESLRHYCKQTNQNTPGRRHHPTSYMQIQVKSAPCANSFFPWTIPLWNSLPHDILDITDYQTIKTAIKIHFSSK